MIFLYHKACFAYTISGNSFLKEPEKYQISVEKKLYYRTYKKNLRNIKEKNVLFCPILCWSLAISDRYDLKNVGY